MVFVCLHIALIVNICLVLTFKFVLNVNLALFSNFKVNLAIISGYFGRGCLCSILPINNNIGIVFVLVFDILKSWTEY